MIGNPSIPFPSSSSFFPHKMTSSSSFFLIFIICFFFSSLFLFSSFGLLSPPIRITPKPPIIPSEDPHGPLAVPEPADGFEFVGIGIDGGGSSSQQQDQTKGSSARKGKYRRCTFKYIPSSCNSTDQCDTHRLCVQVTGDPCCAQGEGECPPPIQLDVNCLKQKPINWCHHDQDCARAALCCDTGCGYNMCVERHQI